MLHHERLLVMRAADAIEKITRQHREFLQPHKDQLLSIVTSAVNKELKWHLAQLLPRLDLTKEEHQHVWGLLYYWVKNPNESKITRVSSLQALFEMSKENPLLKEAFEILIQDLEKESIPSLQARIRKLKKAMQSG
jgi:hypothetical protein